MGQIFVWSMLFVACSSSKEETGDDGFSDTSTSAVIETPEHFSDCRAQDGDALELFPMEEEGEPAITDDTLSVAVGYSGGCESHEFVLCWPEGAFMESAPVQAGLEIWHNGNNDTCEMYNMEVLSFDLTPLKESYQAGYGTQDGEITIVIGGSSVSYLF